MLSPLCGTLQLEYELVCRSANFMNNCMNSCNAVVNFVARNGIFFQRMASPLGRNAQWCCDNVVILLVSRCTICVTLTHDTVSQELMAQCQYNIRHSASTWKRSSDWQAN